MTRRTSEKRSDSIYGAYDRIAGDLSLAIYWDNTWSLYLQAKEEHANEQDVVRTATWTYGQPGIYV